MITFKVNMNNSYMLYTIYSNDLNRAIKALRHKFGFDVKYEVIH